MEIQHLNQLNFVCEQMKLMHPKRKRRKKKVVDAPERFLVWYAMEKNNTRSFAWIILFK